MSVQRTVCTTFSTAWLDYPTFFLIWPRCVCPFRLVCVCCTCLHCTVASFWCSSCLAVFTVQAVATVYLDFPPCSSAAALASGTLPGSNSMCTSMLRLGPARPVADVWLSRPHPRLRLRAAVSVCLWKISDFFFFVTLSSALFISFLLAPSSQPSPPLPWAGWVARLERFWVKNILCYLPARRWSQNRGEKLQSRAAWTSSRDTPDQKTLLLQNVFIFLLHVQLGAYLTVSCRLHEALLLSLARCFAVSPCGFPPFLPSLMMWLARWC